MATRRDRGAHLRRSQQIEDGYFLTSLRKYTQGGTLPAAFTPKPGSTQGRAYAFDAGAYKATALFSDPANASPTYPQGRVWDTAGDEVVGRYGIVVHNATGTPYAAHLVRGTKLKMGQQTLITTNSTSWSAGVDWGSTTATVRAWGTLDYEGDATTTWTVSIYLPSAPSTVYVQLGTGTPFAVTTSLGMAIFNVTDSTTFRILTTSSYSGTTAYHTCD